MMKGLSQLPEENAEEMRATQMELLAQLPAESRRAIMATMDDLVLGRANGGSQRNSAGGAPNPGVRMPQIPMSTFLELATRAFPQTLMEAKARKAKVLGAGYLYHFVNGATYGMAFTLIFGRGSWALAIAWGIFVWAVMMVSMPRMMPMIKFPFPRFLVVPLIAHIAMAIPIGFFAINFVTPDAHASSLVGGLGLDWLMKALGLG
jgi:hypothetical protein